MWSQKQSSAARSTKTKEERKEIINDFTQNTSAVGFLFLYRSRSLIWKFLWLAALLTTWILSALQVHKVVHTYFRYETHVSTHIESSQEVTFPAVTVCNLNPITRSFYEANQEIFEKYSHQRNQTRTPKITAFSTEQKFQFFQYVISAEKINISKAGHQLKDMLIDCEFQSVKCSWGNFSAWSNAYYGNCFTMFFDEELTAFMGPSYGLKLTLYAQNKEYISVLSSSVGFRVHIHAPEYVPFPEDQGFSVAPGFYSSISLREVRMSRQPLPYDNSDCGTTEKYLTQNNMYRTYEKWVKQGKIRQLNYTSTACIKDCYEKMVVKDCDCYDPGFTTHEQVALYHSYVLGDNLPRNEPSVCNMTNKSVRKCLTNITKTIVEKEACGFQCPHSCFERTFKSRITSSLWPEIGYFENKLPTWKEYYPNLEIETQTDAQRSIAKLEIYFENRHYDSITETPAMDLWTLMSNIGGIFGLYTGICFLTMLEFVEFCCSYCRMRKRNNEVKKNSKIPVKKAKF